MKIFMVDIQDGNGIRIIPCLDKEKAMEVITAWLNSKASSAYQSWLDECMDTISEGRKVQLANLDSIELREGDLDLSGVLEVMEDAKHTLGRQQVLLDRIALDVHVRDGYGLSHNTSRYLATEQALHLITVKLQQ